MEYAIELYSALMYKLLWVATGVLGYLIEHVGVEGLIFFTAVIIAGIFQIMIDRERHPDDIFERYDNIAKRHRKALVRELAREIRRQDQDNKRRTLRS